MPKVKIDFLRPGMVVAADVRNMDEMLLIPAGCEITERHVQLLQTWGIRDVQVGTAGVEGQWTSARDSVEVDAGVLQAEKHRFWNFDDRNPVQQEVLRLVLRRKVSTAPPSES